jgi:cellobiose-specific phosphotransferase system component IIA
MNRLYLKLPLLKRFNIRPKKNSKRKKTTHKSADITVILYVTPFNIMNAVTQTYKIAIGIAVIFGLSVLMIPSFSPTAAATPAATTNQTNNQTGGNMTTTAGGGGDQASAKMHLDEGMKALQAGDTAGAEMHMGLADQALSEGEAKMHLGEAIKALQAGDTAGAETHAQLAQDTL